ncbi:glycoside hydrolase family 5 protein [Candidatus Bathyarchaeota archaeon]|nr:glycoside hydrolase family 5 protein [Candidatus Bathyarchaeota archaeon]MBS7613890.1 glycoside hydrolase family 5 protein [Candidatus Bathyarchaeota archaeon]MBS7617526.1 glycoside hydrolase family 5 protein [Candidatus Bathyarchaeota archaeon]
MYLLTQSEEWSRIGMHRGINIGNALEAPREGDWGVYIKDEYFKVIREAGFDTVRIPIRWSAHADQNPPYKINETFFIRVDHVVSKALEQDLIVIINIHHYEEMMQDPVKHRERFMALWRQIAEHYKDYSENLYFELLNEPSGALTSEIWNELLADTIRIIREINPTRKIIIGPVDWNSVHRLKDLMIPEGDENIIVTFHLYTPFEFTHQGAEWVSPSPPMGRKWFGTEAEKKQIRDELDIAVQWSMKHNNITLLLGEFGAYSKADIGSRIRWTYFVAREAEKRNIAWCYWEFCAGFGAYDPIRGRWREELLNALIPKADMYYVSVITDYGDVLGSGWYYKGTYATVKLSKLRTGFLVLNVFDHFEGLKPEDKIVDERTVEVYVDEHRGIHAVWRKDYSQLMLLIIGVLIAMGAIIILLKRWKI